MATKTKATIDPATYPKLIAGVQSSLNKSGTAYTPNVQPTPADFKLQLQLMNLQAKNEAAKTAAQKSALYGDDSAQLDLKNPLPPKEGPIVRGLRALSMPHDALVGLVELATGQAKKSGLSNIPDAINRNANYGDILRNTGLNKWASMPLGFALDVALDPVNWLTAGTEAVVPKLAVGLKEGGIEGLTTAAKSAALSKTQKILRWTPFIDRSLTGEGMVARVASKASAAEDAFRQAAGLPSVIEDVVSNSNKPKIGQTLLDKAIAAKIPGAQTIKDKFLYSPKTRWEQLFKQANQDLAETAANVRKPLDDVIDELSNAAYYGNSGDLSATLEKTLRQKMVDGMLNAASETALTPPAKDLLSKSHSFNVQNDFANMTEDLKRANEAISAEIKANMDETGIKWYDNLRQKVNNTPYANKLANAYEKMMGWFKVTKVGLNPTSYTNAVFGNATMAGMMGMDITDPRYLDTLKQTFNLVRGKAPSQALANAIATSADLQEFVTKYSKLANEINLDSAIFEGGVNRAFGNDLAQLAHGAHGGSAEDLVNFAKAIDFGNNPAGITLSTPSLFSNDIFYGPFNAMLKDWSAQPAGIRKSISNLLNKSATAYGSIDQTFKIGTLLHLHVNGVTAEELKRIGRLVPLAESDITKVGNLYKLSALKAGAVANEAFMNYAAMPSAIKMLRSMPVLGSPFASFTYGAIARTAKTAVRNPAFFNKVTFARDEVSHATPQTPIEKAALGSPLYNYLNTYGRVKLPFFQTYPTYLNVANWLPYLGMNTFNPSEREYTNDTAATVGGFFDKLPFLKTPEGQILFDYIIQPYVLGETQPTGQFGQALYPQDASGLDKAKSIGVAGAQAILPSWLPPGYRFNQLYNALQGKNAQGVQSNKSGWELTGKAGLSTLGVPINDINLGAFSSLIKKQVEPPKSTKKKK